MWWSHLTTAALRETVHPPLNSSLTHTRANTPVHIEDLQKTLARASPVRPELK